MLELWSGGGVEVKELIQVESRAFSNTPILQYSSAPKPLVIFTVKSTET
jgi:hypothetical protein